MKTLEKSYSKSMSGFTQNIYDADRSSQSIALIGGATAQSYDVVGLQAPRSSVVPDLSTVKYFVTDSSSDNVSGRVDVLNSFQEKDLLLAPPLKQDAPATSQVLAQEEQTSAVDLIESFNISQPELMSRYQDFEQTLDGFSVSPEFNGGTLNSVASDNLDGGTENNTFSLIDFLAEIIERAQSDQAEFETSFDGSRQGEIRDFIDFTGGELSSNIRSGLQDNVAGVPREALGEVVDSTGLDVLSAVTDPVLAVDYYGESAILINDLLGAIVQPIGAFSLPQIGPLLADPQSELFNSLA